MKKEYLERFCWGIELFPGILAEKGWFAWPTESCEEGLMVALFKTRSKARGAIIPSLKHSCPKLRVVRVIAKLEWERR